MGLVLAGVGLGIVFKATSLLSFKYFAQNLLCRYLRREVLGLLIGLWWACQRG